MSETDSVEYADAVVVGTRCAGSAAAIALVSLGQLLRNLRRRPVAAPKAPVPKPTVPVGG